jgi:hypothetical protein
MPGRRLLAICLPLVLVLLTAVACGGGHESPKAAYAKQLSKACNDMRTQVEALGKPADTPIAKLFPGQVKIGHGFLQRIKALQAPAAEAKTVARMQQQYGYYFEGLHLGYALLVKRESQQAFVQTVAAAVDNLNIAKRDATALGATDCTRDAFG